MSKHKITFKDYNNHLFIGKGLTVICQHVNTERNAFYDIQQQLVKAYGTKKSNKLQSKPTIINTIQGINLLGQCPNLDGIVGLLKAARDRNIVLFTDNYMTLHYISQFAENTYNDRLVCPNITFACMEVYKDKTLTMLALAGEEVPLHQLKFHYSKTILDSNMELKASRGATAMYNYAERLEGINDRLKQDLALYTNAKDITEVEGSTIQYMRGFNGFLPKYHKGEKVSTATAKLTNGFELSIECWETGKLTIISHYVEDNKVYKPVIFSHNSILNTLGIELTAILPTAPICNLLKFIGFKFADNFQIL